MNLTATDTPPAEANPLEFPTTRSPLLNRKMRDTEPVTPEVIEANHRHDRKYGWDRKASHEYTNMARLPEFIKVPPGLKADEEVWSFLNSATRAREALT